MASGNGVESSRASDVFRSLWKGRDRLVGAQGRFRVELFVQKLDSLDWRSLGSLLVQLLKPLQEQTTRGNQSSDEQRIIRCAVALAATISHMQAMETLETVTPVNAKFVSNVFGVLVQAVAWVYERHPGEFHLVAHYAFRALSTVLASAKNHVGGGRQPASLAAQRFAYDAVLDGVLGRYAKDGRPVGSRQGAKKRRTDAGHGAVGHAEFLKMLGAVLSIRTEMRTDRYVVRILRLRSGAVIRRILGYSDLSDEGKPAFDADVAKQLFGLVGGLAGRCSGVLKRSSEDKDVESDEYVDGIFACIRDILPLVHMDYVRDKISLDTTDQLLSLVSQLALDLASAFRPLVLVDDNGGSEERLSVYSYCTQKRHRCYQWAALCRIATWISCWGILSATSQQMRESCVEAMAECGRVCWLQCFHAERHLSSAEPSVWLLLLSESLHHMVLEFPHQRAIKQGLGKPPFTLAEKSQSLVFSLVAALLSAIGARLDELMEQGASRALFLDLMAVCDKIVCLVRPRAASMGLFEPQSTIGAMSAAARKRSQDGFKSFVGSPAEYICRPIPLASTSIVGKSADTASGADQPQHRKQDVVDESVTELQREAFEEIVHEIRIAGVFSTLDKIIRSVASLDEGRQSGLEPRSGMRSTLSMAFRVALRWIGLFATSARNNVNHQTDVLDGRNRVNIRLVGDRVRLNKSATDWSRLQRIPILRIDSDIHPTEQVVEEQRLDRYTTVFPVSGTDTATSPQDDAPPDGYLDAQQEAAGNQEATYGSMMARILRFLTTLSVYKLLAENCQSAVERCLVWPDSRAAASDSSESAGLSDPKRMVDLCQRLERLLSDADFDSSAFHSLQIVSSIVGVRSHLYTSDIMELRMPHTYLRDHSPRSSEALMQMAMDIGLCRLLLEPAFIVRTMQAIRSGKLLRHPRLVCAVQIWLDMVGNVIRHSLFRCYLGIGQPRAVTKSGSSGGAASANTMPLVPFSVWWSLALSAATQCMLDVFRSERRSDKSDWGLLRLLFVLPSHLLSWYIYIPMTEESVRQMSCLGQGGLPVPASYADSASVKSDIGQLYRWLALFNHPERSKSILYVVYYLATRLWLEVPFLNNSDACEQSMRVCKDVWGIACNSLQLLVRLIQQSTPWQDFVALGLVDDFARILKMLFSRQNMPGLVLRLISNRSVAFKGDAPSDELLAASDSEQSSEGSNAVVSAAEPSAKGFTADDLVGRLLYESALRHDSASKRRSSSDFFSIGALAKLWTAYIDNLLRLPVTVILNASSNKILEGSAPLALFVGGSGSGGSGISVAGADSGTAGGIRGSLPDIRVNLRDWLCDKSSIPFDMLLPLLDVKEQLSKPNALWAALETVFPIDQLVWAINGVERSSISQACMSAALVMPDISASRPRASAIESVIKNIFLLASQHIVAASGGDDGAGSRYSTVLLYLVWRQLPVFLQKIDLCAAQLEHAVVCLAKQLGAFDLAELAAFGLEDGLLLVPPSPKSNTASLLFLNGDDRDIAQPLVATSMALLVEHSPVFAAMLTGEFSEAQTVQNQKQAQLTLQSSHSILVGLFDVFHRLALLLHPTPDAQWESEVPDLLSALAMSVRQKYSLEDQAAILDMAVYYELRPVSVFLIWSIIKQTASQTASGAAVSVGVLEVLAAMLSEEWGPYFGGDEVSVCLVQRSLAALLLLHLDKLDFASTIGASTDVFLDCLSFIFKS